MAGKPEYWSIKKGAVWWFSRREREDNSETTLRLVIAPDLL
jgi:phosphohistidine phosphatase